jgi:hypothetical protein
MKLEMGSQVFEEVDIPLLWGERAVLQDQEGALSVIDLSGPSARLEVVADGPAPGVEFVPIEDGFIIRSGHADLYSYAPNSKSLTPIALRLPEVQVADDGTRIGSSYFEGNVILGSAVGIHVSEQGISIGAPLPEGLAELVVPPD